MTFPATDGITDRLQALFAYDASSPLIFSSGLFLFLFAGFLLVYSVFRRAPMARIVYVIAFSLYFYYKSSGIYFLLLVFAAASDFLIARGIYRARFRWTKRWLVVLSVAVNLGMLGYFKYTNFLIDISNQLFGQGFLQFQNIFLPVGISFFVFQSMSYTIDLYRRQIKVQKNAASFMAFVTLFPQIVAGPIVRYEDIQNEIDDRTITEKMIGDGISRFIVGLGKKVLIANNIGLLWTEIKAMDYGEISAVTAWLGILAFTFQIYFDFSGYSDMAIGLGKMMGFHFPENFNYPYMSHSVAEFWRRWHITLGDWFKSYIYFPMGGSRKGLPRTIINLLVVWTITGIWHGASWNFMLWGTYFGILIVIERLFLGKVLEKIPSFFSWLYTFIMVVFGWVMFDAVAPGTVSFGNVFEQIWTFISAMFGGNGVFIDDTATNYIVNYGIIFAVCIFGSSDVLKTFAEYIRKKAPTWVQYGFPVVDTVIMLASVAYLSTSNYNPFLYFNF